jgi:hypothetical protein
MVIASCRDTDSPLIRILLKPSSVLVLAFSVVVAFSTMGDYREEKLYPQLIASVCEQRFRGCATEVAGVKLPSPIWLDPAGC